MRHLPDWLTRGFSADSAARDVRGLVGELQLTTVCESAVCPNLRECWSLRQLTFMILGNRCTRSCGFCAVSHGRPEGVSEDEPWRVAEAARRLKLAHVVITSVARDDLPDEGAGHFVNVVSALRQYNSPATIEVLVPDFHGRHNLIEHVMMQGRPDVFAHNIETIERLSDRLRPQAGYNRSLNVLRVAAASSAVAIIKSSIMVGLGERPDEICKVFHDLRGAGVTHLTLGQYLRPDVGHLPVMEFVSPERFASYERLAYDAGFTWVMAGPFVRSSYNAKDGVEAARLLAMRQ